MANDLENDLLQQVERAIAEKTPLNIVGGGSKSFLGNSPAGDTLSTSELTGIVDYEPSELVVTVKAGTPVVELQHALAQNNQMLGFEPPVFSDRSTIGGAVASGLAGSGRPYRGGVRDFVLGVKILTGKGEILKFGGQVMKNVAGFDVSRLMAGAMGTLGVLLEVSLRVVPVAETEVTLEYGHSNVSESINWLGNLLRQPLPVTAACWYQGKTRIRISGSKLGVDHAVQQLNGDISNDSEFWSEINHHKHPFFDSPELLRISTDCSDSVALSSDDHLLVDWGGAQRWLTDTSQTTEIREAVAKQGGHATVFRSHNASLERYTRLPEPLMLLQKNLKNAFDPHHILNRGRLYPGI